MSSEFSAFKVPKEKDFLKVIEDAEEAGVLDKAAKAVNNPLSWLRFIPSIGAGIRQAEKETALKELDTRYNTDKEYYLIKGGDVSDFFKLGSNTEAIKAAGKAADRQLKATYGTDYKKRPTYSQEKAKLQAQFLAIMTQEFGKQFAEGGAVTTDVNMMTATPQGIADVNVEEMSTTQPKQDLPQLSYDEIRARLPKEISDDIVTLLANSYEALADFAEIRTQADVDAFNLKYQVQLVLPQEA